MPKTVGTRRHCEEDGEHTTIFRNPLPTSRFLGVAEDCCMLSILLAVPSCTYSFWHGVIPTSYFIFNDFYTCIIISHRPTLWSKQCRLHSYEGGSSKFSYSTRAARELGRGVYGLRVEDLRSLRCIITLAPAFHDPALVRAQRR